MSTAPYPLMCTWARWISCKILEYQNFSTNRRANVLADIEWSNIVEVLMHFWTELLGVKRVKVRGEITVICGTYKFDIFYFNCCIDSSESGQLISILSLQTPHPRCALLRTPWCGLGHSVNESPKTNQLYIQSQQLQGQTRLQVKDRQVIWPHTHDTVWHLVHQLTRWSSCNDQMSSR